MFPTMKVLKSHFETLLQNPLSLLRFFLALSMGSGTVNKLNTVNSIDFYSAESWTKTWILNLFPNDILHFIHEMQQPMSAIIVLCALGAAFGFLGRVNLFILALLSFLLGGITEGLGNFDHNFSLPSQVLFVLALVPGSMKISLDGLLFKKTFKRYDIGSTGHSGWGLNLILALLVTTYFTAGISKIRYGGAQWLEGSTLRFYLQNHVSKYPSGTKQLLIANKSDAQTDNWKDGYGFEAHTYGNYQRSKFNEKIADWLVEKPRLVSFFALMTLLIEVGGFVVFFNSKWRNAYLVTAILMHTSIGVLMGLYFTKYRLICFCLMDWKPILSKARKKYVTLIAIPQR